MAIWGRADQNTEAAAPVRTATAACTVARPGTASTVSATDAVAATPVATATSQQPADAPHPVQPELREPVEGQPAIAVGRVRERVGAEDAPVVDHPAAAAQVPPQVVVERRADRDGEHDEQGSGQQHPVDGQPAAHRGESRRQRAAG